MNANKITAELPTPTISEWEEEIINELVERFNIPYADAAGALGEHCAYVVQAWEKGMTPSETAALFVNKTNATI